MRNMLIIATIIGMVFAVSCIDDDGRCGDYEWDAATAACIPPSETDTNTDTNTGTGTDTSTNTNVSTDSSTSPMLGEPCNSDADCAVYNANYCNIASQDPFCTLKDCMEPGITCPTGFACCDASTGANYLDHCMQQSIFDQMGGTLCVNAQ